VLNFIFENSIAHFCTASFIEKFSRMAAQDNDGAFLLKFLLKIFQVRQHMETVDAAVGPKVNQNDFPL